MGAQRAIYLGLRKDITAIFGNQRKLEQQISNQNSKHTRTYTHTNESTCGLQQNTVKDLF